MSQPYKVPISCRKPDPQPENGSTITIERLIALLPGAVLLPIPERKKAPTIEGWQQVELSATRKPDYQRALSEHTNTGVLLGQASGSLCAIDVDSDEDADTFLTLNPALQKTLRSKAKRGCQFWVYIVGNYPRLVKLKDRAGKV
jgi:hypothetical protein